MDDYCFPTIGDENKLPLYLVGVGRSQYQHHLNRVEGYPYFQLINCAGGEGILRVDGEEYKIVEGQGFYLPPNVPHEYFATYGYWETHWTTFEGRESKPLLESIGMTKACVYNLSDMTSVEAIFKKMLFVSQTSSFFSGFQCSGLLYQYILELYKATNTSLIPPDNHKLEMLAPVISHIDENFASDLTLEELSQLIGLSPQYLCRLFKECLSMRPFEYLTRRRIQQAKNLLLDSDMTISEIAPSVGYNDSSYFCAVFKRHEMLSPAEFRAIHKH